MPTRTTVYLLKDGATKLILEHSFERLPEKGEFISIEVERNFVVDEVWHMPNGISPTARIVVSVTAARPPR